MADLHTGRIIKALSGFYYVKRHEDEKVYACKAKGIFRKRNHSPLVGDLVDFEVTHEGDAEGNVCHIHDRESCLFRPAVANVDLALVIFALKNPDPNTKLIDKMLVELRHRDIEAIICLNKADLAPAEDLDLLRGIYEGAGYKVFSGCAKTKGRFEGFEGLYDAMKGHISFVCGPSGAGKSTLINGLFGKSIMETGDISKKSRTGKQTTRHVELVEVGEDTFIADTPGFSSLDLADMEKGQLADHFPEFIPFYSECKYTSCSHIYENEEDCSVKQALSAGKISELRYESYRAFYEEIAQRKKY